MVITDWIWERRGTRGVWAALEDAGLLRAPPR